LFFFCKKKIEKCSADTLYKLAKSIDVTIEDLIADSLDTYLKELAKEFRKLNGTAMPAEIILIGGAAILAQYGFREMTYDTDAVILASSAMKEAVNLVGDKFGLLNGWLNMDFKKTKSYSDKLSEVSVFYKTFSNILNVRMITAEYLIAMKLMSGRQYKNDLSDVAGILWEHQKRGKYQFYSRKGKAKTASRQRRAVNN